MALRSLISHHVSFNIHNHEILSLLCEAYATTSLMLKILNKVEMTIDESKEEQNIYYISDEEMVRVSVYLASLANCKKELLGYNISINKN